MYKISNNLSPLFMRDMMTEICVPYNMRSTTKIEEEESGSSRCTKKCKYEIPGIKTVSYGLESIRYLQSRTLSIAVLHFCSKKTPQAIKDITHTSKALKLCVA